MSKVDWSLASIHATHAGTFEGKLTCWYMLEGGKWFYSGEFGWEPVTANSPIADLVERPKQPQAWSGPEDGLPPVGEQIDIYEEDDKEWVTCKVVYVGTHDGGPAVIGQGDDVIMYGYNNGDIRKPHTAADKRESAIRELMDIAQVDCRVTAARLVDAGFKREVV